MESENVTEPNNEAPNNKIAWSDKPLSHKIGLGASAGLLIVIITLFFTFDSWFSGFIWTFILMVIFAALNKQFTFPTPSFISFGLSLLVLSCSLSGNSSTDCSQSKTSYSEGHNWGTMQGIASSSVSCETFCDRMTDKGINMENPSECFCQGYNDGIYGRPQKYKKE